MDIANGASFEIEVVEQYSIVTLEDKMVVYYSSFNPKVHGYISLDKNAVIKRTQ